MIYNLLNFPAGVVPVSTVTAEDEEQLEQYKGNYQDRFDRLFKKVNVSGELIIAFTFAFALILLLLLLLLL